jgi:hypothetical protein
MITDAECRNAICPPDKKNIRKYCSNGLYLEVGPNGSKRWFWVSARRTHLEYVLNPGDSVHDEYHAHHGERGWPQGPQAAVL